MAFEDDDLLAEQEKLAKQDKDKLKQKRLTVPDKRKIRNLKQYKDLSEEEFEKIYQQKTMGIDQNREFEERIQRQIKKFGEDYDLEDLNSNDSLILRSLAQHMITLEDLELETYNLRKAGLDIDTIMVFEKLERIKTDKVQAISRLQDDLKITRRVRKSDKDESVQVYLENLKKKAKEFYESKMQLVFCPKCNTWIGSIWTLYPSDERNKITLVCNKENEAGEICGEKIIITTKELQKMGGSNKLDIPESIK